MNKVNVICRKCMMETGLRLMEVLDSEIPDYCPNCGNPTQFDGHYEDGIALRWYVQKTEELFPIDTLKCHKHTGWKHRHYADLDRFRRVEFRVPTFEPFVEWVMPDFKSVYTFEEEWEAELVLLGASAIRDRILRSL